MKIKLCFVLVLIIATSLTIFFIYKKVREIGAIMSTITLQVLKTFHINCFLNKEIAPIL